MISLKFVAKLSKIYTHKAPLSNSMYPRHFTRYKLQVLCTALLLVTIICRHPIEAIASQPQLPAVASAVQTVEFLTSLGPRTPNSPAIKAARQYLSHAYEQAGYVVETQAFSYQDLQFSASSVTIGSARLQGNAMPGSAVGQVSGPLSSVAYPGSQQDFDAADLAGAIGVVRRSDLSVTEQLNNAILSC